MAFKRSIRLLLWWQFICERHNTTYSFKVGMIEVFREFIKVLAFACLLCRSLQRFRLLQKCKISFHFARKRDLCTLMCHWAAAMKSGTKILIEWVLMKRFDRMNVGEKKHRWLKSIEFPNTFFPKPSKLCHKKMLQYSALHYLLRLGCVSTE